jgi:molecular chaperone DnaK (HSP70)
MGSFTIANIPKAPAGVSKVDVTFDMDSNGILDVIVEDVQTGNEEYMTIDNCAGIYTYVNKASV